MHTGAVLLDIEKAFDTVWHNAVKLIAVKCPTYLILVINSYLRLRRMFVSCDKSSSNVKTMFAGVPQGSVLGPLLFNFYIHDLPKLQDIYISLFADDMCLCSASYRVDTINNRLNKAVSKIYKYYTKWKIKVNDNKTEAILFTKRRPVLARCVKISNHEVDWVDDIKYLGVIFDRKLTFTTHVNYLYHNAIGKLVKLYPLLNGKSALNREKKLILYKTLVRPAMVYSCPAWSLTCKTNFGKLQRAQNKFLRVIGNYPRRTRIGKI